MLNDYFNLFNVEEIYPAIRVNKISDLAQICSTVGDRLPSCRRRTLLKT